MKFNNLLKIEKKYEKKHDMLINIYNINNLLNTSIEKYFKILFLIIFLLSFFIGLNAKNFNNEKQIDNSYFDNISFSIGTGLYNGIAHELVYNNGTKISQLDWKSINVPILKLNFIYDPKNFFIVNFKAWSSLGKSSAYMDDYDWIDISQEEPTHHSWHPNTNLNYANEIDLNLKVFFPFENDYSLNAIFGYQMNNFSWSSIGGNYSYYNGTVKGQFENTPIIEYEQNFYMFYIGFGGQYSTDNFTFSGNLKYSPIAYAKDIDYHRLRDIKFVGQEASTNYFGLNLEGSYDILNNLNIFCEFNYNEYFESLGNTKTYTISTNQYTGYSENSAGISNRSFLISAGLKYTFDLNY